VNLLLFSYAPRDGFVRNAKSVTTRERKTYRATHGVSLALYSDHILVTSGAGGFAIPLDDIASIHF
jgi:hypothetical protein